MLRHIEKQVKKHTLDGGEVLPVGGSDSESDSESSSSESNTSSQSKGNDDCDSTSDQPPRVPQSLLKILDQPLCSLKTHARQVEEDDGSEPENEAGSSSSDGEEEEEEGNESGYKICIICPGKQLKTEKLSTEHLKSKAHLRRLERYRNFIHHPPPHTLLSPDPSDVIELLDASIGPPPIIPTGTKPTSIKGKRKKREKRREKRLRLNDGESAKQTQQKIENLDDASKSKNEFKRSDTLGNAKTVSEVDNNNTSNKAKNKRTRKKKNSLTRVTF
ncbi:hypothetical protein CROQUDRAFT_97512 [Cronartium quercuum f. sp. fusiforme G11]|uniref:Uncharacterized protein n=1 Tax=Cronartium quercuum f. sp. fusiforme G11 TaxID=708437 RepID=A0A9P6T9E4_9BASI|nr:hypothetical protein CROQUDRAFT_97512 [Cronartium quercuum f. sp. fusiforme G11]